MAGPRYHDQRVGQERQALQRHIPRRQHHHGQIVQPLAEPCYDTVAVLDSQFYQVFQEIGAAYPDIAQDRYIIDIGAARLATQPERFDVIVTPNLYGDIISDIAAEITGSIGLAGSANVGEHVAMFEAIHGSAPDIAGQDKANPSGLLLGAVMMLVHIRQAPVAPRRFTYASPPPASRW